MASTVMRRARRRDRYTRRMQRLETRSAGDHRACWPSARKCATCGARYVRLYRSYGSFLREEEIVCNAHLPASTAWRVPVVEAADGSVWGYTSCPTADIKRWQALPDVDPAGHRWGPTGWVERGMGAEGQVAA